MTDTASRAVALAGTRTASPAEFTTRLIAEPLLGRLAIEGVQGHVVRLRPGSQYPPQR
jgi:hypothetical protein